MSPRMIPLLLSLCVAAVACEKEPEEEEDDRLDLTCDVTADPEFCWTVGAIEAYDCIDDSGGDGVFSADRSTCAYPDGVVIAFDDPVPVDPFSDDTYLWSFTVRDSGGGQCARFVEADMSMTLTATSGDSIERASGFTGIEIECPGGEVYYTSNAFDLFECTTDSIIPGYSYSGSSSLTWSLIGGPDDRFGWWTCADPVR